MKIEIDLPKFKTSHSVRFKSIKAFKTCKSLFLITALASSWIAISIAIFIPKSKQNSQFEFPQQVTLSEWRSYPSENLPKALINDAIATKRYAYTSSTNNDLRIDILYINRRINLLKELKMVGLNPLKNSLNERYLEMIGHHILFQDQERTYLSSCINSRGGSTVTEAQFNQNRNTFDITPERLGLYLLGIKALQDTRCLLVIMSIPLINKYEKIPANLPPNTVAENTVAETNSRKLERAWIDLYKDWQYKFPET